MNPAGDFSIVKLNLPRLCGCTNCICGKFGKSCLMSGGISGNTIMLICVPTSGAFATSVLPLAETR